jgi:hypothetical protein
LFPEEIRAGFDCRISPLIYHPELWHDWSKTMGGGRMKTRFVLCGLVFCLSFMPVASASSLDSTIVGFFPRDVAEVGYANLDEARGLTWFAQFKQQTLPGRLADFEQFLAALGIDPNLQIKEVAWAIGSTDPKPKDRTDALPDEHRFVGVAIGQFDPESTQATLKTRKVPTEQEGDSTLYACETCNDLYIVFLDSNTIAFGQRESLGLMMKARQGIADNLQQNGDFMALINQANDEGLFWGVLGPAGARQAIHQLFPDAGNFPQTQPLFAKINGMVITVRGSDDLEVNIHLLSSTPQDAATLSVLLQAGLLLRQQQSADTSKEISKILDTVRINPGGSGLDISLAVSNDQIVSLIQKNSFVL